LVTRVIKHIDCHKPYLHIPMVAQWLDLHTQ